MAIILTDEQKAEFRRIGVTHLVLKDIPAPTEERPEAVTPVILEWHNGRGPASKVAKALPSHYVGQIEQDGSVTEFHQADAGFDNYTEPTKPFTGTFD